MSGKIIALVGMCGSGKTEAAEILVRAGFKFLRFGQITMDEIKRRNLEINEDNEKKVRESLRDEYGMAAYAVLNIPKIENIQDDVAIDGLYSWAEYEVLKEKYGEKLTVLAIYSSPKTRYARLEGRELTDDDKDMKKRPIPKDKAAARDKAEIENIQKAGPIAMADYTIINEGSIDDLKENIDKFLSQVK